MNPVSRIIDKIADGYRFIKAYGQHLPMAARAIYVTSCAVMLIRGVSRNSGKSIVLLYVGRNWNYDFLVNFLFRESEVVARHDASLFNVHSQSRHLLPEADIEIIDIGWPYVGFFGRHGSFLEFADWINMTLPIEGDWSNVIRSFRNTTRNNDLRLIRRNQYRFELATDSASAKTFYEEMYLPSVSQRHGDASIIAPLAHVLKRARQGKLLQVFKGDDLVIAGVIYPKDDILYFLWQGAPQRFRKRPPEGAVSALYYFGILYAFDNGLHYVDFAGTRPFMDFGDFRFKRKWGAFVDDSFSPNALLVRPLNNDDNTISLFEELPLIARGDDGLEAVVVRRGNSVNEDTLRTLDKYYNCEGLARFVVIDVFEIDCTATESKELNGREYCVIQCSPDQFSTQYVER